MLKGHRSNTTICMPNNSAGSTILKKIGDEGPVFLKEIHTDQTPPNCQINLQVVQL